VCKILELKSIEDGSIQGFELLLLHFVDVAVVSRPGPIQIFVVELLGSMPWLLFAALAHPAAKQLSLGFLILASELQVGKGVLMDRTHLVPNFDLTLFFLDGQTMVIA